MTPGPLMTSSLESSACPGSGGQQLRWPLSNQQHQVSIIKLVWPQPSSDPWQHVVPAGGGNIIRCRWSFVSPENSENGSGINQSKFECMQMSKTYIQATERIYRGVVAKPHSWPWIAKLKVTLKIIFVFLVVSPVFCEHGGIWLGLLYMHDDLAMQFQWIWHFLSKSFSHLAVATKGKSFFLYFAHHRGCIPKPPCNLMKHISLIH